MAQMPQMHVLNITDEQLNIIATGLSELPYRLAAPVFAAINAQINEAQAKVAAVRPDGE
ncbi:hypothetical protein LJR231_002271 [Phyllobacterium sp. LjRoot231]|uniref:hypothetical protein n=1 Tax=Phyllobacterium sp. LjRoot231 TaxID=3342289 RepID=UPI003ED0739A